jgi:hypothetical protein
MSQLMKNKIGHQKRPYKDGGMIHDDVKEDKAMVKGMVKPAALKKKGLN